jgi:CAAX protease family protein
LFAENRLRQSNSSRGRRLPQLKHKIRLYLLKFPLQFYVWAWANLFFTCVAEEALFRGFLQRHFHGSLKGIRYGGILALVAASVLFGVAHYAGGVSYIVLATVAGLGYGWIYQRTNSIEASILTHFTLNAAHFVFFTYPALRR